MEIRQARAEEIPALRERLKESPGEQVDLDSSRVWVAVERGKIIGLLSMRLVWQVEPLLIFPEASNTQTRRRAGLGMYRAAMDWLKHGNQTGVRMVFGVTYKPTVSKWLVKLGWLRIYTGAKTFLKVV